MVLWFSDDAAKEDDVKVLTDCYTSAVVILATALGFFSRMCSLESQVMLESKNHLVTVLSGESWPEILEMIQKQVMGWKVGLELGDDRHHG